MTDDKRKILFFDIDGTLITNDSKRILPESTKEAIRLARENGHLVYINSGRVMCNIEDFIKDAGFDGFVCGCGTYITYGDNVLFHNTLSQKLCRETAYKCREYNMYAIYEHTDATCYDSEQEERGQKEILDYFRNMKRNMVDNILSEAFLFDKFVVWYDERSNLYAFKEYAKDYYQCIQREGSFLEMVPNGFSKATGIKYLLDFFNIKPENAYVFGDSNNDIQMFEYVKNSIAMKECSDDIRKIASYVTDSVINDGIYKAMKHFEII